MHVGRLWARTARCFILELELILWQSVLKGEGWKYRLKRATRCQRDCSKHRATRGGLLRGGDRRRHTHASDDEVVWMEVVEVSCPDHTCIDDEEERGVVEPSSARITCDDWFCRELAAHNSRTRPRACNQKFSCSSL